MDPLRLLSRSTNRSRAKQQNVEPGRPSSGQNSRPQLFTRSDNVTNSTTRASRKRKRGDGDTSSGAGGVEPFSFFGKSDLRDVQQIHHGDRATNAARTKSPSGAAEEVPDHVQFRDLSLSLQDRKKVLRDHKLKVTWLNPRSPITKETRKRKDGVNERNKARQTLFPNPLQSFNDLVQRYSVANRLTGNVTEQGFHIPTEVQLGALPLLLAEPATYLDEANPTSIDTVEETLGIDLLTIAPTGSGKTLAFLIPLLHSLRDSKSGESKKERHTSAIVLAPTRELASQIVNEGRKLAQNTGIRITQMRKGMRFDSASTTTDENAGQEPGHDVIVKADIVVSTPGVLQSVLGDSSDMLNMLPVRYLVLDEADVLLDPLFREQTLAVWTHLNNPVLRISMWSATMGSNVEELAASTVEARRTRIFKETGVTVTEAPLIRLVVGLKDSAVPNVQHKLIYAATEQGKLTGLRQLLHPATTSIESGSSLRPPFLVFTQTIERAIALHSELLYDIPAEAGGIDRIAVLHSDLSDTARDRVMTRFRKGEIWVLITTDLLSRGVDFLGVNGVVNYDIPTSSAAYVHRIGRTGRAGREGGVAVTLYSKEDIPYLKHVATIVAMAQKQGGITSGVDQWLLDALPKLSKNEKQNLRRRGIESRATRGKVKDPKTARRAKISTKSGYDRRLESRRKGAAVGSQRREDIEVDSEVGDESDFAGFD